MEWRQAGGRGTVFGAITLETGSGPGAFLAPSVGTKAQTTLTLHSALTLKSDSTYTCTFKARFNQARSDRVIAIGVTIESRATFTFTGTAQEQVNQGVILTVVNNASAAPTDGAFSNLPDDAILTVDGTNFLANYEGGVGHDLTLTVTL